VSPNSLLISHTADCDYDSRSKGLDILSLSYLLKYIFWFIYIVQSVCDRFLSIYFHRTICPRYETQTIDSTKCPCTKCNGIELIPLIRR